MSRDMYGQWGMLDPSTLGKALLALGITASYEPDAVTWDRPDQINRGLLRVIQNLHHRQRDQRWNQQDPGLWTDPLLLSRWRSDDLALGVLWARAWAVVEYPPRSLAMSVGPDTDVIWLTSLFRSIDGLQTVFVSSRGRQPTAWRLPLRIGFLPDLEGREALQQLVSSFPASSWRSTLIDPFVVDTSRVSCDILLINADPWEVPSQLFSGMSEIRAGAVFIAYSVQTLHSLTVNVIEKIASATGAWAVGVTELSARPEWIVDLVEELSHAFPLANAFDWASQSSPYVLMVDPQTNARETIDQRAVRLAVLLRSIATPRQLGGKADEEIRLAQELSRIAEEGRFSSEAGDASDIRWLEDAAAKLIDRAGSIRRLQVRISAADSPHTRLTGFLTGTEHSIEVRIGPPPADSAWLISKAPFAEETFQADRPQTLTVVLTEPHLLDTPLTSIIELPVVGTSTSAVFALTTRSDTRAVDARIIVSSGNRILQTAQIAATVGQDARLSEPELFLAPTTASIADRRTFRAAFLINHGADDTRRTTVITGNEGHAVAAMVNLDSLTVATAVKLIADRLNDIVDDPANYGTLDSPASLQLLVFLAFHGAKLRNALVRDTPGLKAVLERSPSFIQVVSAKADAYFPFEFAYDFPAPDRDARLCPDAIQALRTGDMYSVCPGIHTEEVVCPLGFWGLHRVIERHAYQPETRITDAFMLRSAPTRTRGTIRLGRTVFAASARVDAIEGSSIQQVADALHAVCDYTQVPDWVQWRKAVAAQPAPGLLMLLPHTTYLDDLHTYALEIGNNSIEYKNFHLCLPPSEPPVLVTLLGCETATVGSLAYEQFPAEFRIAGAEVVIATLTQVLGRHAAPMASKLVAEIYRQCSTEAHGMGEVMLIVRRKMVAEAILPVLALASFGDADWLIGP